MQKTFPLTEQLEAHNVFVCGHLETLDAGCVFGHFIILCCI